MFPPRNKPPTFTRLPFWGGFPRPHAARAVCTLHAKRPCLCEPPRLRVRRCLARRERGDGGGVLVEGFVEVRGDAYVAGAVVHDDPLVGEALDCSRGVGVAPHLYPRASFRVARDL